MALAPFISTIWSVFIGKQSVWFSTSLGVINYISDKRSNVSIGKSGSTTGTIVVKTALNSMRNEEPAHVAIKPLIAFLY